MKRLMLLILLVLQSSFLEGSAGSKIEKQLRLISQRVSQIKKPTAMGILNLGEVFCDIFGESRLSLLKKFKKKRVREHVISFTLSGNGLTSEEVNDFLLSGRSYSKLQMLKLTHNNFAAGPLLIKARDDLLFPALTTLHLDNCKMSVLDFSFFEHCPKLSRLYIKEACLDEKSRKFLELLEDKGVDINFTRFSGGGAFTGGSNISGNSCY